jgi:hypothetical protein
MTSKKDKVSFSHLRKLLRDLGFVEAPVPGPYRVFEHAPSETLLFYRDYQPQDAITWADHVKTRKFLDERGILEAHDFEALLHKTVAK